MSFSDSVNILYKRGWKIIPTSCACGGSWAWVKVVPQGDMMYGCICHHSPYSNINFPGDQLNEQSLREIAGNVPRFDERDGSS
jgi:hypothetical protein